MVSTAVAIPAPAMFPIAILFRPIVMSMPADAPKHVLYNPCLILPPALNPTRALYWAPPIIVLPAVIPMAVL
ncbi:hypothetical protein FR483_n538R [Paramecium bursaria Chlorella virus FR483]|uniref:Uncharacterized protein n538R n=1 Tax=Paramecium bursaria Chlorella virus FR483 TaxID=399781 RepID=A7J7P2_PBCVF|nr:hypothetical protein FR483_n538R [Paramecium bursaria Chlorella virus FR483]ABT15823.1 hypothetical protein FR483_n538R [Paramecium bursaria Chlorella virus FR483]